MTDSTHVLVRAPALPGTFRLRIARFLACYAMIAACIPYLIFKIVWLSGSTVGTVGHGAAEMGDMKHVVGNVITVGMDLVAVIVALAFTYRWGQRIPVWLVLVPIWVGTGLLAPIALGAPLGVLVQMFTGGSPVPAHNGLKGWVYSIIYGGFTLQAIMLLVAFVLYARTRWAGLFGARTKDLPVPTTRPHLASLANSAAVVAVGYGVMQIAWVLSDGGLGGDPAAVQTVTQKTFWAVQGLLCFAGAIGLLALVHRWGTGRIVLPLVTAWVGTGVIFASGPAGVALASGTAPAGIVVFVLGAVTGLLMGTAGIRLLIEHRQNRPMPQHASMVAACADRN